MGSSVMSNNTALILGSKHTYFLSWTHKIDSQACQSNQDQHVPRHSSTVRNKLLLKGNSVQMKFTSGSPTPDPSISWHLRDMKPTWDGDYSLSVLLNNQVFNCTASALGLWTVDLWSPKAWIRSVSLRQNDRKRDLGKAAFVLWEVAKMIMVRKAVE